MNYLKSIEIKNYRSFTSERIRLDDITCIVGANESGKSNLLDAISHLARDNQKKAFTSDELRMGAPQYPSGTIEITYTITLTKHLLGNNESFASAIGRTLFLTKKGTPKEEPVWCGRTDTPQSLMPDLIRIDKKAIFSKTLGGTAEKNKRCKQQCSAGWFVRTPDMDFRRQPFRELIEKGVISRLSGTEKQAFFGEALKSTVLDNVKIFRWAYKEGDFLPERVNIEAFVKNPRAQKTVTGMFRIAGWSTEDLTNNLIGETDTVYGVLFEHVQRKIDSLIRTNWNTHDRLTVKLEHKGEYFTIRLKEPGSKTPPEYRSDGLKWYLTFLINFRARNADIKNYILLIDEPGLHLHPRGQKDTLRELRDLSSQHDNQVVYTTHQTFLINKNSPGNVRVLERKLDRTGPRAADPFFASRVSDIANSKESVLTDKLLREALGFHVSDVSPINERNLLVEGVFDREFLHIANKHWQLLDLNEISIIACSGASNIAKHAALYKANRLTVLCLYDSDELGVSALNKNDGVAAKEKIQIKNFLGQDDLSETIEDLIPDAIFAPAFKKCCQKWGDTEDMPSRPRMKGLANFMQGKDKTQKKHSLEDYLTAELNLEFEKHETELGVLKTMLEDCRKRLS